MIVIDVREQVSVHEIPLEDLIAPMVVIDVREQVSVSMRFH